MKDIKFIRNDFANKVADNILQDFLNNVDSAKSKSVKDLIDGISELKGLTDCDVEEKVDYINKLIFKMFKSATRKIIESAVKSNCIEDSIKDLINLVSTTFSDYSFNDKYCRDCVFMATYTMECLAYDIELNEDFEENMMLRCKQCLDAEITINAELLK